MKRIIHVDNSDFFRKQMQTFLEGEGFKVEGYESAQEAGFAIAGGTGDIVIMGLTFADHDGEDFVSKVVEAFSGPIIVVSSSVDKETEKRLIEQGVVGAVSKSGNWKEDLRAKLDKLG